MADFKKAYEKTLVREGGYGNRSDDSGNWACGILVGTHYGISAPVLQEWIGRCPSSAEMFNLPLSTAKDIYKSRFWDVIQGDKIKNQSVAEIIFDTHVLQGGGKVNTFVGRALNDSTVRVPFSQETVEKINKADQERLFVDILQQRINHVTGIGGVNLRGWLNRLETFTFKAGKALTKPINFKQNGGELIAGGAVIFGLFLIGYYFIHLRRENNKFT